MLAAFELANDANTGAADPDWNPGINDNMVHALVVTATRAYAGGVFTSVNTPAVTRNYLAAFDLATGAVDPAWHPDLDNACLALAVSGGKVYAGGLFTTVNGATTRNRLAAFAVADGLAAGTADPAWHPDLDDDANALVVQGGTVYAGGRFTTVGGGATARHRLAAFAPADGGSAALPRAWAPAADGSVQCLAPWGTGLFAGGYFATLGGRPCRHLAGFHVAPESFGCETPPAGFGAPTLAITAGAPRIGTTFDLTIHNPSPTAAAASLGFEVFVPPTPSPQHSLVLFGFCWNLPLPFLGAFVPVPVATTLPLALPHDPAMDGLEIDWQVLAIDPASTSTGLALTASRGMTTRIST